jgi:hypothetical protein
MRISGLDDGERGEVVISVEKVWTQVLFFCSLCILSSHSCHIIHLLTYSISTYQVLSNYKSEQSIQVLINKSISKVECSALRQR